MPERLPKGWIKATLGEVCAINPRPLFDESVSDHTEVSFVPMAAVEEESGRIDASQVRTLGAVRKGYTPFQENDVIFAKITPCMENGKIAMATDLKNGLAFGSTEFFVFRPYEGVLPRFVLYFLLQPKFREDAERQMTGASGQKRVPAHYLFTHEFWLPPTREQERIVAKLDASLLRLERAERAALRAQERLKHYHVAVLHSAITGDLTRVWRKTQKPNETGTQFSERLSTIRRTRWEQAELQRLNKAGKAPKDEKWKSRYRNPAQPVTSGLPRLPDSWTWISIDQLAWSSGYGTSVKCTYEANGPAVLRISNIRDRKLNFEDLKFATSTQGFRDEDFVAPGDMLLIRTNGSKNLIGRIAIVKTALKQKCSFASYLIRFRLVADNTVWSWVSLAWGSDMLRSSIESRAATTAGQYNISLSGLADLAIPLPPIAEQTEITREVERRLSAADRLVAGLGRQLNQTRVARQSLLREAFAGDLVPQSPDDEPASVLLGRIRSTRSAEAKKPKGKRMSKPKSNPTRRLLLDVLREHEKPMTPEQLFREAGFQPAQAELFYRELNLLRKLIREKKPSASEAKTWPQRAHVLLELKKG